MEPKKLLKIRLREDGTWEHVYEHHQNDIFQELDAFLLNELQKQTRMSRRERMQKKAEEYIEEALELSDYEESKIVLSHIMNLK
jgi:hypothetical protein